MGVDLFSLPDLKDIFEASSDTFGFDVREAIRSGPLELLNTTLYAQAALLSVSMALSRLIGNYGLRPGVVLGFSLGQVSSLYASGLLGLEDTLAFAKVRAEAMEEASLQSKGAMSALLGADGQLAEELCFECAEEDVLVPANYNCPGQIVISGDVAAVERAEQAWRASRRKCIRLSTAGAFHSPLMEPAAARLKTYLAGLVFSNPEIPVINNVDARILLASNAAESLSDHLTQPVLFQQSVELLRDAGVRTCVELGSGSVLTGLVKRIDKNMRAVSINSLESLEAFLEIDLTPACEPGS